MKDLIDETKKNGLQGIYNLPEGATFMVPVTAYEMSKATTTEMAGGGGGISSADVIAMMAELIRTLNLPKATVVNPLEGENLTTKAPGEGFTFGGQEYKMFGPPVPEGTQYTVGNPMPVMITNWQQTLESPAERLKREYELPAETPLQQQTKQFLAPENQPMASPIPTWVPQWLQDLFGFLKTPPPFVTQEGAQQNNLQQPSTEMPPWLKTLFSQQSLLATPATPSVTQLQEDQRPITTALNLSVDSNIKLLVDGRTLATIIKPYLYEDLLRFGTSTTSSTSRSVIA
jgi:hypothetical protein